MANNMSSVAIILPRLPSESYALADILGPQIGPKLSRAFDETAMFFFDASAGPRKPKQPVDREIPLMSIAGENRLVASRQLAARLSNRQWSLILIIADCALVHSIVALRNAGLAFCSAHIVAIVDSASRTRTDLPDGTDDFLAGALNAAAIRHVDRVIDIRQMSSTELALVGALVDPPTSLLDCNCTEDSAERRWAVVGAHSAERLNAILDNSDAQGIGIVGEDNCATVAGRHDLTRFDLIPRWGREATLRYLVCEQRTAVVPPGTGLERLDCMLLKVPFTEDFQQIFRDGSLPLADLRDLLTPSLSPTIRPARGNETDERFAGCRRFDRVMPPAGDAVALNWDLSEHEIRMPPRARLRPAAAAALANLDADIVVAGINNEGDEPDDLLIDPLTPAAGPARFTQHAPGCVILLRTSIAKRFGADAQAVVDAVKHGAVCQAVPIAAAECSHEDAMALRLRLARIPTQPQAERGAPGRLQTMQRKLLEQAAVGDAETTAARQLRLLDIMVTAQGVKLAKEQLVVDPVKNLLGQQRPIALANAIRLKAGGSESFPVCAHGHCFLVAKLDPPFAMSIPILFSIDKGTASDEALLVFGTGEIVAFFQPIYGTAEIRLDAGSLGMKQVTLLNPTLHTTTSWRLSGQKLQAGPIRPSTRIAPSVSHAGAQPQLNRASNRVK
jgi:hypothetical protein